MIRQLHGPGDQRKRPAHHSRLHRDRQERRTADRRRRSRRRRRLLRPADRDRGRPFQGPHFPGGDFRPGPRRHQAPAISTTRLELANDTEYGLTGAVYSNNPAKRPRRLAIASLSATSTSIGNAPARWSERIPLADSICPARIRRRAARITCYNSCKPSRSLRRFPDPHKKGTKTTSFQGQIRTTRQGG